MFSVSSTNAAQVAKAFKSAPALFAWLFLLLAFPAIAQTDPPPGSYIRSYLNDVPNDPLISVSVTGAVDVACLTIEEDLPASATALDISGDGVYLPALNAIRWGPYFNTVATNVSYRITGLPASYPVNGGAWMDGAWYFSPGVTMVPVLPASGGAIPTPPQQVPAPIIYPPSGSAVPVDVLMGLPGSDFGLLNDSWMDGIRTNQNLPQESAWFASASSGIIVQTNSMALWPPTNSLLGLTYFTPNATTPVALGVGDTLTATLKIVFFTVASPNNSYGLRVGLFDFADSTLSPTRVAGDGFGSNSQGNGVQGYCLFQNMGTTFDSSKPMNLEVRTNVADSGLEGTSSDYSSMNGNVNSNNFTGFVDGQYEYVLTLTLNRTASNALAFSASWLDTATGGTFSSIATNTSATDFRFDGLSIRSQSVTNTASIIVLTDFRMDYFPAPTASVPTNAAIYYTLDGSLPTQSSMLYTGAFDLASASVVRAAAFATNWAPSVASVAYYGYSAILANAQFGRSISGNASPTPTVTFSVTPGTNASCLAVTESLPSGLAATNISAGGSYIASNNVVLWGPFFGTNVQTLSYQAVGEPGTYPVQASWSVDGVSASEAMPTNIVIIPAGGNLIPTAPPQVASAAFVPPNGGNVPTSVTITDATPGAVIYYTLDGSLPTQSSVLYTGAVYLASASEVRAAAFTNGWTPSVASVAYYGPPAATANAQVSRSVNTSSPTLPVVSFNAVPGAGASCVAVTESLPAGLSAVNVSTGGNYLPAGNAVVWGPFLGTNQQTLSYQAVGLPGTYPVRASWSVDGVAGTEAMGTNIVIASANGGVIPAPPPQVPTPVLTPAFTASLPVTVVISNSDAQAQIYYTTDGSLPMQNSSLYTGPLTFNAQTTLRAVAFQSGYLPSVGAAGEYVPVATTNSVPVASSISGNGTFLPTVSLIAAPQSGVNCYAVVETIPYGLTPSSVSGDGVWNPATAEIFWGPYLDNQPRMFSFNVGGPSGVYQLPCQVSFNGFSSATSASVQVNANYSGSGPVTNLAACASDNLTYNLDINPAPGVVTVTNATGTVNWGDGTQSQITQPIMMFEKAYSTAGTYAIVITANWTGYTASTFVSGTATRTDSVEVVTICNAPQIITQPSNQVVLAGSTAQFTVSASSSVPMTFQWYLNTNAPVFSPSAFADLSLLDVSPLSAGLYSVLITNAFGSVTSREASLVVVTPLVSNIARGNNGNVTLNFIGLPNAQTRIWATTNLAATNGWVPIFTNTVTSTNGTWQIVDTNASGFPWRFYRFSTP